MLERTKPRAQRIPRSPEGPAKQPLGHLMSRSAFCDYKTTGESQTAKQLESVSITFSISGGKPTKPCCANHNYSCCANHNYSCSKHKCCANHNYSCSNHNHNHNCCANHNYSCSNHNHNHNCCANHNYSCSNHNHNHNCCANHNYSCSNHNHNCCANHNYSCSNHNHNCCANHNHNCCSNNNHNHSCTIYKHNCSKRNHSSSTRGGNHQNHSSSTSRRLYSTRCLKRARSILWDCTHPGHRVFKLLRFRLLRSWTNRLKDSFYNRAVALIQRASSVLGCPLDPVEVVSDRRMVAKLSSLLDNISHPMQETLTALSSSFSGCGTHGTVAGSRAPLRAVRSGVAALFVQRCQLPSLKRQ
ncbi:hypothetical protein ACER0C_016102 [Sarotherodon galilaeus]